MILLSNIQLAGVKPGAFSAVEIQFSNSHFGMAFGQKELASYLSRRNAQSGRALGLALALE